MQFSFGIFHITKPCVQDQFGNQLCVTVLCLLCLWSACRCPIFFRIVSQKHSQPLINPPPEKQNQNKTKAWSYSDKDF